MSINASDSRIVPELEGREPESLNELAQLERPVLYDLKLLMVRYYNTSSRRSGRNWPICSAAMSSPMCIREHPWNSFCAINGPTNHFKGENLTATTPMPPVI